uniref:Putative secreted protein n=1 Tax=Ixodes ricinus TaxID=34613 RepID=A0A6B0UHT4_IXORI
MWSSALFRIVMGTVAEPPSMWQFSIITTPLCTMRTHCMGLITLTVMFLSFKREVLQLMKTSPTSVGVSTVFSRSPAPSTVISLSIQGRPAHVWTPGSNKIWSRS